jgi:hypothetical protein
MKASELKNGNDYLARVRGGYAIVTLIGGRQVLNRHGKYRTVFDVVVKETGQRLAFPSARKLTSCEEMNQIQELLDIYRSIG